MSTDEAGRWIARLDLRPHPEGGYYRETYRAPESIPRAGLPARYDGDRAFVTAVYYLLRSGDVSTLHRLRSDELWFFHAGSPLRVVSLAGDGTLEERLVGHDTGDGARLHAMVPAGRWFGAMLDAEDSFALVSCVVAPGFEFADFELASRAELIASYPGHADVITRLTRPA